MVVVRTVEVRSAEANSAEESLEVARSVAPSQGRNP
jgi:hypothetical protein